MSRASGLFSVRRVRQQVFEKSSPQGGQTAKGAGGGGEASRGPPLTPLAGLEGQSAGQGLALRAGAAAHGAPL